MNVLFDLLARVLDFFYGIVPNYGFAIICLTLVVMIILTPLTLKGTRSMMMMQQLQPELKKLQSKYKDDIQKRNEEMMKFYKENNINPIGGCLPLLVQMPVFLVLYQVLKGLTQRIPTMGTNVGWVTGQSGVGSGLSKPPIILKYFQPDHLPTDSKMYQALSQTNTMPFFGMDLSESAQAALSRGIGHALPYLLLILVVGTTGFVQQRQIQGRMTPQQRNDMTDQQRQQQQIMKFMPIFLPVISFGLPSGLVVYFAVSNLYRVGQQWFISRSIYGIKRGDNGGTASPAAGDKRRPGESGGTSGKSPSRGPKGSGGARRTATDDGADDGKAAVATKTKTAAATAGAKSGAKAGAKTSTAPKAKSGSASRSTPAKSARNGSGRTTASKTTKPGAAKPAASGGSKPAGGDTAGRPPLQPRARKNKKR